MAIPPIKNVARLDIAIKAAGVAIDGVNSNGIVSPTSLQAAAQSTIDAFDDSDAAQLAFENVQARAAAAILIDTDKSDKLKLLRATAGLTIDELNVIRQWITDFKVQVAAATTLADLKTRVAGITPNLPARTQAQAITAIKSKVNAGTVD